MILVHPLSTAFHLRAIGFILFYLLTLYVSLLINHKVTIIIIHISKIFLLLIIHHFSMIYFLPIQFPVNFLVQLFELVPL